MREPENIRAVEALGVDWIGFICWPKSSRYVADTPSYLPACERVGVFVNADIDFIRQKTSSLGLSRIQLHGDESVDFCKLIKKELQLPIIKAISVSSLDDITKADRYQAVADHLLFDTKCKCVGGSGEQFDWNVLQHYTGNVPFLLSGGIGPNDVQQLSEFQHPQFAGIDVNSRFEDAPALKNIDKLSVFLSKVNSL